MGAGSPAAEADNEEVSTMTKATSEDTLCQLAIRWALGEVDKWDVYPALDEMLRGNTMSYRRAVEILGVSEPVLRMRIRDLRG